MANSMTGFGRGFAECAAFSVTVEISTVNRKQFDATIWLPREWLSFEVRLLGVLREGIGRGAVKCTVSLQAAPGQTGALAGLAERYRQVQQVAKTLGIASEGSLADLVALCAVEEPGAGVAASEEAWALIVQATRKALAHLQEMRQLEGARITADLQARLGRLHELYERLRTIAPGVPEAHRAALQQRIESLMPSGAPLDPGILEREVALFADRCDVSEELTRLGVHFAHAEKLLTGEEACGRALDFLCQEFFREINTTGSKCGDHEMSRLVIDFKTLLETIREQVQNLV